jgi:hypothetical protein
VNITGSRQDLANTQLTLVVIDQAKDVVQQGMIRVDICGSFAAAVPTQNFASGRYKFGFVTSSTPRNVIAGGELLVSRSERASVSTAERGTRAAPADSFFRTFGLAIPGVAYTTDNFATNTRTVTVAAGAVTKSTVRIDPEGSYVWNSSWDGKVIRGQWRREGSAIILLNAQSGLNWRMQTMAQSQGKATVTLWDQNSIWYHCTPLP